MLKQIEIHQFKPLYLLGLVGYISIAIVVPVHARDLSSDSRNIEVDITRITGHLFDWSQTDRRIKSIMVDNPEVLTKSILFSANGCTVKVCNNSSILLISARAAARIGEKGTIRVITTDRQQRLHPYTITIRISKRTQSEHETKFFNRFGQPAIPTVRSPRHNFDNRFIRTVPINFRNF
jgi:hypothetical protein